MNQVAHINKDELLELRIDRAESKYLQLAKTDNRP